MGKGFAVKERWLSLHLFYGGNLDDLWLDGILPVVRKLLSLNVVAAYYYVRYWNGGPHLRLRLALDDADSEGSEAQAKNAIVSAANHFFSMFPGAVPDLVSYRAHCSRMAEFVAGVAAASLVDSPETTESLQPTNTVQQRRLIFEVNRFGGTAARPFVENHFCRSSEIATAIISGTREHPGARLTISVHFAAVTVGALGGATKNVSQMLIAASEGATLFCPEKRPIEIVDLGFLSYEDERLNLEELVHHLRHGLPLPEQSGRLNAHLRDWRDALVQLGAALDAIATCGSLTTPKLHILFDCLHMMNNRLDIPYERECYIYYLVGMAVAEVASTKSTTSHMGC